MKNKKDLEKLLKVLANSRRLGILEYLKSSKQASVGDVAGEINLSFHATSKHLVLLFSAGLVDKNQINKQVFYRLSDDYNNTIKKISSQL